MEVRALSSVKSFRELWRRGALCGPGWQLRKGQVCPVLHKLLNLLVSYKSGRGKDPAPYSVLFSSSRLLVVPPRN